MISKNSAKFLQVLNDEWVLTAGHCLADAVSVEVYFGAINRYTDGRFGSYTKMIAVSDPERIIVHTFYDPVLLFNDIALIHLPPEEKPIDGCYVKNVTLLDPDFSCNLVGKIATVSGFGVYSDAGRKSSPDLYFIQRPIVLTEICALTYGWPVANDAVLCLDTSNGQSTCNG